MATESPDRDPACRCGLVDLGTRWWVNPQCPLHGDRSTQRNVIGERAR